MLTTVMTMMIAAAVPATPIWPYSITARVDPRSPVDSSLVSITLSGECDDTKAPLVSRYEIVGNVINVDLGGAGHDGVMLPIRWSFTEQLGMLPAGTYKVYDSVYYYGPSPGWDPYGVLARGPELLTTFTVVPEPATVFLAIVGVGALFTRRRA